MDRVDEVDEDREQSAQYLLILIVLRRLGYYNQHDRINPRRLTSTRMKFTITFITPRRLTSTRIKVIQSSSTYVDLNLLFVVVMYDLLLLLLYIFINPSHCLLLLLCLV